MSTNHKQITPQDLRVYKLDDTDGAPMGSSHSTKDEAFLEAWELCQDKKLVSPNTTPNPKDWDYVQVILRTDYERYGCGNTGCQAWRHRTNGFTIPDTAVLQNATGHMWKHTKKRDLKIHPTSPVLCTLKRE